MTDINAFGHLADDYADHRPGYPSEILDTLREFVASGRIYGGYIVDVGAGTGISTRLLAKAFGRDYHVVGIEPCLPMLQKAMRPPKEDCDTTYLAAVAEDLPFRDKSACLVSIAQALHWFDRPRFYAESARILEAGGCLAIMQNNRDWENSAFLNAYESFLETHIDQYSRYYRSFDILEELINLNGFQTAEPIFQAWERRMSLTDFIGLCFSSTKIQKIIRKFGRQKTDKMLRNLVKQYFTPREAIPVGYRAELYMARRFPN